MEHPVRLLQLETVTHDTRRLVLEKPPGYRFEEGAAAEIAIDRPAWREECRPFSFTSLPEDEELEFIIKIYPSHEGVTRQIADLEPGAKLLLTEPFGTIRYRGEGYFIAGGTGITPFIAILRRLARTGAVGENTLLYSVRAEDDIILRPELETMLGTNVIYNLTHEPNPGYNSGLIDLRYLRHHAPDTSRYFYVCGPDDMVRDIRDMLQYLGVARDSVVVEE
ncbi:MAG: FAD-binding oxidoreductase [Spirochaetaceae bacterium]